MIARIRANAGKEEYAISEIFLAVDNPKDEDQVKVSPIISFSKSKAAQASAASPTNSRKALRRPRAAISAGSKKANCRRNSISAQSPPSSAKDGDVIGPIRSASGYHILGVREKRTIAAGDPKDVTFDITQAFRPLDKGEDTKPVLAEADAIRYVQRSRAALICESTVRQKFPDPAGIYKSPQGKADERCRAIWIADKIKDLPTGHASDTIATGTGALLLFHLRQENTGCRF